MFLPRVSLLSINLLAHRPGFSSPAAWSSSRQLFLKQNEHKWRRCKSHNKSKFFLDRDPMLQICQCHHLRDKRAKQILLYGSKIYLVSGVFRIKAKVEHKRIKIDAFRNWRHDPDLNTKHWILLCCRKYFWYLRFTWLLNDPGSLATTRFSKQD